MKYRVHLQYEDPRQAPHSALVDERYTRGALFYGQWGRAIVTKCYAVNSEIQVKTTILGRTR